MITCCNVCGLDFTPKLAESDGYDSSVIIGYRCPGCGRSFHVATISKYGTELIDADSEWYEKLKELRTRYAVQRS